MLLYGLMKFEKHCKIWSNELAKAKGKYRKEREKKKKVEGWHDLDHTITKLVGYKESIYLFVGCGRVSADIS